VRGQRVEPLAGAARPHEDLSDFGDGGLVHKGTFFALP
jgi:hypothetical protein